MSDIDMMEVYNGTGTMQVCSPPGHILPPGQWTPVEVAVGKYYMNRPGFKTRVRAAAFPWREKDGLHLGWQSPINYLDGYGSTAEDMIEGLLEQGVCLHLYPVYGPPVTSNPAVQKALARKDEGLPPAVGISYTTPGTFARLPTPYKIGLTMYESTRPTALHHQRAWSQKINRVDLLLTPGQWLVEVWRDLGVRIPIRVIELPGGGHFYKAPAWERPEGHFTVITWAIMRDRKSPVETAQVFMRAFPRRKYPDHRLIIKTRDGFCGGRQGWKPEFNDARITIIDADYTPSEMVDLIRQAHVCLYLSRGEGSGRTPREALGLGLPLICADNTSMATACDSRFMYPIPTKSWERASIGGEWAVPDWDYAVHTLRHVYANYGEAMRKARRGREWAHEHFSPAACAKGLLQAIADVEPHTARLFTRQERERARTAPPPGPGPRGTMIKVRRS